MTDQGQAVKQCLKYMSDCLRDIKYCDIKNYYYYKELEVQSADFINNVYKTTFWDYIDNKDVVYL